MRTETPKNFDQLSPNSWINTLWAMEINDTVQFSPHQKIYAKKVVKRENARAAKERETVHWLFRPTAHGGIILRTR